MNKMIDAPALPRVMKTCAQCAAHSPVRPTAGGYLCPPVPRNRTSETTCTPLRPLLTAILRPRWGAASGTASGNRGGYLYDVDFEGETVVNGSRQPGCDLARVLRGRGLTGSVKLTDADTGRDRYAVDIAKAARLSLVEVDAPKTGKPTFKFRKWKPFDRGAVALEAK